MLEDAGAAPWKGFWETEEGENSRPDLLEHLRLSTKSIPRILSSWASPLFSQLR